jgi:putative tricarboxylic transport membrane protein
MEHYLGALVLLFDPTVLGIILLCSALGLVLGAIPGLTAIMGIVLLIPFTFYMGPVPAIAAIVALSAMAIFSGDIPGALLRIPGTPASAAYTDEAYRMTQKGMGELALGISLVTSALGGIAGAIVLLLAAPPLADVALRFSSFEYFWLAALGLSCSIVITAEDRVKGFLSLFIGLLIAAVGQDPVSGQLRFTFGSPLLIGGFQLVPVLVGLYAVSEVLRTYTDSSNRVQPINQPIGNVFAGVGKILSRYWGGFLQGNVLGTIIGILPGGGADTAAWISYALAKRFSKEKEKFGTGHPEALVAAGAANNASISGAYVPAVVFGIPGDTLTAIVIGVLFQKGLNPGPTVFLNQPEMVYAIIFSFFLANLLMLPMGFVAIKLAKQLVRVPRMAMMPLVLTFAAVGAFAGSNSIFAMYVVFGMGILGWVMELNRIPVAPAVLGLVLGPMIEESFLTSLLKSHGDFLPFFERPIAGLLGVATIIIVAIPIIAGTIRWVRHSAAHKEVRS